MSVDKRKPADAANLDEECGIWDWVRAAGISAAELREWLTLAQDETWNESPSAVPS
jgi:hypothetical protein